MSKIEIRKAILGNRIRMFLLSYARRLALPLNVAYFYYLLLLFCFTIAAVTMHVCNIFEVVIVSFFLKSTV